MCVRRIFLQEQHHDIIPPTRDTRDRTHVLCVLKGHQPHHKPQEMPPIHGGLPIFFPSLDLRLKQKNTYWHNHDDPVAHVEPSLTSQHHAPAVSLQKIKTTPGRVPQNIAALYDMVRCEMYITKFFPTRLE